MKVKLKNRLAILPLLACSTAALAAEPLVLSPQIMDRVTAGTQPVLEHLVTLIETAQGIRADLGLIEGKMAWLASNETITFHWTEAGELVANKQLQSGEQLTIVKQLTPMAASSLQQLQPGDTVTTRILQPGETLKIQQASTGGTNYLFVRSAGNSTVTLSQQHL